MKKIAILSAFLVFGFVTANAQQASTNKPTVAPTQVVDVAPAKDASTANEVKKDTKHCSDKKETKSCGDAKTEGKKSCCSSKKTEAKKEENQ